MTPENVSSPQLARATARRPVRWPNAWMLSASLLLLGACRDDGSADEGGSMSAGSSGGETDTDGAGSDGYETAESTGTETATDTDGGGTADFAAAPDALIQFAIETGLGFRSAEAYVAMLEAETYADASQDTCPSRQYTADTMVLGGDPCEATDGTLFGGEAIATNAITWRDVVGEPTYDASKPMRLSFESFSVTSGGIRRSFDGHLDQSSPDAPSYDAHSVLSVEHPVSDLAEDLATSCVTDGDVRTCEILEGFADVAALGSFEIRGTTSNTGGVFSGWIELVGQQTLRVDLDTVNDGCHPYTIDGVLAGEVCISATEDPLEVELGYGGGCLDGVLHLEGYADVLVDAMTLDVLGPRMDTGLTVVLADPQPSSTDGWVWTAIADTSTVDWECDEIADTDFRAIATLGDQQACQVWGPTTVRFPANCAGW